MALSETPRCSGSTSLDLAATVAREMRCLSLRSASTAFLTNSIVRWRSGLETFSWSQGCGSWVSCSRLYLDEYITTFVLSVGNDQVHLAQFQLAGAQQLLHFLCLQHQALLLIVPKAFFGPPLLFLAPLSVYRDQGIWLDSECSRT